ncbi:MAG TPA: hypothetical protein VFJ05_06960 [Nitrososphaeraceae archaeon]|nr:hypothetical protein [Nitrososphaeraceae archaeon]
MDRIILTCLLLAALAAVALSVFVVANPTAAMAKKQSSDSKVDKGDTDKATDNPSNSDKATSSNPDPDKATDNPRDNDLKASDSSSNTTPSTTTTPSNDNTLASQYPGIAQQGQQTTESGLIDLSKNPAVLPTIPSNSGGNSGSRSHSTSSSSGSKHITKDNDEDDLITSTPDLNRFNVVEMTNATAANIKNSKLLRISFENSTDRFVVYVPSAAGHYHNGTIVTHSILLPHGSGNTNTIVSSSSNVKTTGVSLQQLARDCAFNPDTLAQCKPDTAGNCPQGFSHNIHNNCIPDKCPSGFVRHDNDETGQCFAKKIKGPLGKVSKALNNLIGSSP